MLAVQAVLLSVVASAFAYLVTVPNQTQGWTNQGNQTLSWQRVDTDPSNFTVLLTNQAQASTAVVYFSQVEHLNNPLSFYRVLPIVRSWTPSWTEPYSQPLSTRPALGGPKALGSE
jgi:hypothetical protein